jgi:hypothetical protein
MIDAYAPALDEYLKTHSEAALYRASLLSERCIDGGLGPEDIIALHCEALDRVLAEYPPRSRLRASDDARVRATASSQRKSALVRPTACPGGHWTSSIL